MKIHFKVWILLALLSIVLHTVARTVDKLANWFTISRVICLWTRLFWSFLITFGCSSCFNRIWYKPVDSLQVNVFLTLKMSLFRELAFAVRIIFEFEKLVQRCLWKICDVHVLLLFFFCVLILEWETTSYW